MASFMLAGATLPEIGPLPATRPAKENTQPDKDALPGGVPEKDNVPDKDSVSDTDRPLQPPPLVEEDAAAFRACTQALRESGAIIKEEARIDTTDGCGIARPIVVSRLASDIEIGPPAILRCETALQLQRWTREAILPAINAVMPAKRLAGLEQASAYVCRKRNGSANGKISEHAFGNAIDIAAFRFSDGSRLGIAARDEDATAEGALQRAAVASACLYFRTVLDPGSDAAHESHLHLDVMTRSNGYRYCW